MSRRLPDKKYTTAIRRKLLAWYRAHHRKLPWRSAPGQDANPYRVLVSEAMLQQTQVATVIDYYKRFIRRFPTVSRLAGAKEQQVLRLWQGLGYYRRARNLHACARAVRDDHAGRVPDTVEQLVKLPGIGRYTAAAIASIAFGRRVGVLDGNVARVLARLFAIEQPVNESSVQKWQWALTDHLVAPTAPGDFNQALMELGAVVCTPRNPDCATCPLQKLCRAHKRRLTDRLPVSQPRSAPKAVQHHIVGIERSLAAGQSSFLFEQRPAKGLWSNMWQMPTIESETDPAINHVRPAQLGQWVNRKFDVKTNRPQEIGRFEHQTTHRRISFTLWRCRLVSGRVTSRKGRWRRLNCVDDLPLARPQQRAIELIMNFIDA